MDPINESVEIEGVIIQPLKQIADKCGPVLHMLKNDSRLFKQFGEVYFSEIHSGLVKAWKRHKKQSQNLVVPLGEIWLVIYDDRPNSNTHRKIAQYKLGRPKDYRLIHIPPMLWYGFQGIGDQTSMIANCTDLSHDPEEMESLSADTSQIPYQWKTLK
jgi:dTDP-4-dehydrorhamnose 3,5-epimerase